MSIVYWIIAALLFIGYLILLGWVAATDDEELQAKAKEMGVFGGFWMCIIWPVPVIMFIGYLIWERTNK